MLLGSERTFQSSHWQWVTRRGVMTQVQPPGTLRFDIDQQAEA
jgi:hypothetical protein